MCRLKCVGAQPCCTLQELGLNGPYEPCPIHQHINGIENNLAFFRFEEAYEEVLQADDKELAAEFVRMMLFFPFR